VSDTYDGRYSISKRDVQLACLCGDRNALCAYAFDLRKGRAGICKLVVDAKGVGYEAVAPVEDVVASRNFWTMRRFFSLSESGS